MFSQNLIRNGFCGSINLPCGFNYLFRSRRFKREVLFLAPDEVQRYVSAIPIRKGPKSFDMKWLCFRTLVEVLLGTDMRISDALSLKRSSINFQTGKATIIGKGNKERVVFFSPRALNWVKE